MQPIMNFPSPCVPNKLYLVKFANKQPVQIVSFQNNLVSIHQGLKIYHNQIKIEL